MKIRGSLLVCPSTAPNSDVRKFLGPQCSLSALAICHQPRRWPAISGLATSSKMSQVGEVLGGANAVRDNETVTTSRAALPRTMGILSSAAVFGSFSLLLWMAGAFEIPWLHHAFGIPPIFGWYLSGTAFVLFPMLLFGVAMAWRELPTRNLRLLRQRLRLGRLSCQDMIW